MNNKEIVKLCYPDIKSVKKENILWAIATDDQNLEGKRLKTFIVLGEKVYPGKNVWRRAYLHQYNIDKLLKDENKHDVFYRKGGRSTKAFFEKNNFTIYYRPDGINEKYEKIIEDTIADRKRTQYQNISKQEQEILSEEEVYRCFSKQQLKELAENAFQKGPVSKIRTEKEDWKRKKEIIEYTKRRADGKCELCGKDAPFTDKYGNPFLEVHHIIWLAHNGDDSIDNTVALCPNCHRKMHSLSLEEDVELLQKIYKH